MEFTTNSGGNIIQNDDQKFSCRYFEVKDNSADPKAQKDEGYVYAQMKISMMRDEYQAMFNIKADAKVSNAGKRLIIFNDKSGSMSGQPFTQLKEACMKISDKIFEDGISNFETNRVVFYSSDARDYRDLKNKRDYESYISNSYAQGRTNFQACFNDHIYKLMDSANHDDKFYIIFFTDGKDNESYGGIHGHVETLKTKLKNYYEQKSIESTIFCIGFSQNHDAKLLNDLATAGTNQGNFTYIDNSKPDYREVMHEAVSESIDMALEQSSASKMIISNSNVNFSRTLQVKGVQSLQKLDAMDGTDYNDWDSITFEASGIFKRSEIEGAKFALNVNKIQLEASIEMSEIQDVPVDLLKKVEIEFINRQMFEIVQDIQNSVKTNEQRFQALERLKVLSASLDSIFEGIMKIKDRQTKKDLTGAMIECRTRSNAVLSELRNLKDLSNIPNDVIARLNDLAFKAIKKGGLNKLIDKRAMENENLYLRLDNEVKDLVQKLDSDKISQEQKEVIENIGECIYSCNDTLGALQDGDCMCIGLSVNRPEAAIADSSRLVINDIYPTYISAESFLSSAEFKLQDDSGAHGGFGNEREGELALGLGRENINGVMPLFLFNEHWSIAKRKIQPIFGFMCTLDVMGYSSEQMFTVPFLVYMKAMQKLKENPEKEVVQTMFRYIESTCLEIVNTSPKFQENLINQVVNFVNQKEGESTRTVDVVKSIHVMLTQFICLVKIQQDSKEFLEKNKIDIGKLLRFATEETLRREVNRLGTNSLVDDTSILSLLFTDQAAWKNEISNQIYDKVKKEHTNQNGDNYDKYVNQAKIMKNEMGFEVEDDNQVFVQEQINQAEEQNVVEDDFNLDNSVNKVLEKEPWTDKMKEFNDKLREEFKKFCHRYTFIANAVLDIQGPHDRVDSLDGFLELKDGFQEYQLFAIAYQNAREDKNSKRSENVKNGVHFDSFDAQKSRDMPRDLLKNFLINFGKSYERQQVESYMQAARNEKLNFMLYAPCAFSFVQVLQSYMLKVEDKAITEIYDALLDSCGKSIPDLGRKLLFLEQGFVINTEFQKDLPAADFEKVHPQNIEEKRKLFNSEPYKILYRKVTNYKTVFQIWAKFICDTDAPCVTSQELKKVFPQFKHRIDLYDNCCDSTGKIVKNNEYFKQYQSQNHLHGKRAGWKNKYQNYGKTGDPAYDI